MDIKVKFYTHTAGDGYWTNVSQCVVIDQITLPYVNDENDFGELRAYFDPLDWNVNLDGLIYTDKFWMRQFKQYLSEMGFSDDALDELDYSEQGMQGDDYVSMDVGAKFIRECEALYRFTVNRSAVVQGA